MTLVGTLCCQTGEPATFEHCTTCAKTGAPAPCRYPFFLIKAMRDNKKSRKGAGLSATTLQACDRFTRLSDDYGYHESPKDFMARFRGTIIHGGIEGFTSGEDDIVAENRYFRDIEVDGEVFTISGQVDIIHKDWHLPDGTPTAKISDAKSGGSRALKPDMEPLDSHVEQVNIYRWIVAPTFDVGAASIWYIKDEGMVEVPVPLWSLLEIEEHIRELISDGTHYELPPILPSSYKTSRVTGETEEVRNWKCNRCPLRDVCDSYPREGVAWGSYTRIPDAAREGEADPGTADDQW